MTFKEINQIDVSEHTEQKMNLTYLSWAWAHAEMKKIDENAEITTHEFPDTDALINLAAKGVAITPELAETLKINYKKDKAGAYVKVSVTLNERTETEYLPVMDFKNKAMANPDAMAINKALKRCFVKALALHGLGLYIYAGEDIPEAEPVKRISSADVKEINSKANELAELSEGDTEKNKAKTVRWIRGQAKVENFSDIPANLLDGLSNALDRMIGTAKEKQEDQSEQTSLMDGNTTTPKGDK